MYNKLWKFGLISLVATCNRLSYLNLYTIDSWLTNGRSHSADNKQLMIDATN